MVKRYKLLDNGCLADNYWQQGSIYKFEDKQHSGGLSAGEMAILYQNKWEEITYTELPKYWVVKNDGSKACSGTSCKFNISEFENNPVELLFEEFIELTTKKETKMNRKLVGYNLKFVEYTDAVFVICGINTFDIGNRGYHIYNDGVCVSKLVKANVLDKWFDAVYEDEYKVGDWVTILNAHNNDAVRTTKLTGYNDSVYNKFIYAEGKCSKARKATPEEIAKATVKLPVIAGYKGSYSKSSNAVSYGCKTIYIKTIREMLSFNVTSLTIENDYDIYESDMKDILKYVDNQ